MLTATQAKRVARKIAARVRPPRSDSDSPEDGMLQAPYFEDTTSIVQFNCPEVIDFSTGTAVLPLRITCYCRHHREKVGFRVRFSMVDTAGRLVGQGTSPPIMITDDHKSTGNAARREAAAAAGGSGNVTPGRKDSTTPGRKRAKPYDKPTSRTAGGVLTSPSSAFPSLPQTRATSPSVQLDPVTWLQDVTQNLPPVVAADGSGPWDTPVSAASPTDQIHDMVETLAALVPQGTDQSFLPSAPASPEMLNVRGQRPPAQAIPSAISTAQPFLFFGPSNTIVPPEPPAPVIRRLVPAKGPTAGGTEVTILGTNFPAGVELRCVFGENVATSTQRWSENTLVCIVPPRVAPGAVPVWLEGVEKSHDAAASPMFTYEDESDRALCVRAFFVSLSPPNADDHA
jgi:uncharacterized protein